MTITPLEPFGTLVEASKDLNDIDFREIETLLTSSSLVIIRGVHKPTRERFLNFCENAKGYHTLHWSFGPVMELHEVPNSPNYLFTREPVPFHWDGAFHQVPDFLAFSCIESPTPGAGGETLFTNTEKILNSASASDIYKWSKISLKYSTQKLAHYGGTFEGPLMQSHPHMKTPILRFAEAVETKLNPVSLEVSGLDPEAAKDFLKDMTKRIYDPKYCYRHTWQEGDLLFVDNHLVIHGRTAVLKDEPRHLRRIQLVKNPA